MQEIARIKEYCRKSGIESLAASSKAIVVGLSGGADSVYLLTAAGEIFNGAAVAAAHLDHMIRGEEALRDREFCRELCNGLNIRFFEEEADVSAIAEKEGKTTEEAGRDERYKLFYKCRKAFANELGLDENEVLIATAHNADDNLETVIFNLTRGAGLRGLCGIPPVRDGVVVRPLLCLTSDEIRKSLDDRGIKYVVDSTNKEDGYTRNRIRHAVIPELKKINPSVPKTVHGMCYTLREDGEFIDSAASSVRDLSRENLRSLPRAVASRVIANAYFEVAGHAADRASVEAILDAVNGGCSGRLHLPHSVTAYYGDDVSFAVEHDKNSAPEKPCFSFDATPGEHDVASLGFSIGFYPEGVDPEGEIYKELIYKIRINDKIKNNLFVRRRAEGDVIFFRGHHRKLKKLLCDAGVPEDKRDALPVVCDEDGIVWVPGFPPRDGAEVREGGILITYREYGKEDGNGK